ncbi:MAG: signal peptidase I [Chloroflexi bacterium]|nr:signal peptidase I [Chloroflexota bacterium]
MKPYQRHPNPLFAATAFVLMGVVWFLFAPIQFGGQTAYVIVAGNSMEPRLHRGDLVIVRQASDYQIGDIVTYRHPEIGPIIHRIVAQEGSAFVFKGDNNAWIDSYQPVQAEFIGKFWLQVPSAGRIIEQLRTPWLMALLAAMLGVMLVIPFKGAQTQRYGRRPGQKRTIRGQARSMNHLSRNKADLLFVLATLILASLLLALFAFTRPLIRTLSDDITYQHSGVFSYSAPAPPGIYDTDTVQTGEPIFRRLITLVTMNFDYQFTADQPGDLSGTYRLMAEISNSSGWKWLVELQPEATFSGSTFTASGVLDLSRIQALIDSVEQQTGLPPQQYTLTLAPTVAISGTLAGQPWRDTFSPRLVFQLDELQMQLAPNSSGAADASDPLKPAQPGLLKRAHEAPNTISLLGLTLQVSTARQLAVMGLAFSLAGLLGLGLFMFRATQGDEASRIHSKYGPLLIAVHSNDLAASGRVWGCTPGEG